MDMSVSKPPRIATISLVGVAALLLVAAMLGQSTGRSSGRSSDRSAGAAAGDQIVPAAAKKCGVQGKYAPKCGALWGVYSLQNGDPEQSVRRLESQVGRKFDLVLNYHDFSNSLVQGQFPNRFEKKLGPDHTLFIDWQARVSSSNKNLSYRAIAKWKYDSYVKAAAKRIKAYKRPVILGFDPEFDSFPSKGTPAQYAAAFRHIHNVFKLAKVTNVAWAWVSTGYVGGGNGAKILKGYPGNAYVDWVGWDPYNFYRCNGTSWKTFSQKVTPTYNWMKAHGHGNKPFLLSEYGTQYDSGNQARSKAWHTQIPATLKKLPNLKGLIRFDAQGYFRSKKCDFFIKNGPGSLAAFSSAGKAVRAGLTR
jgi:hypothetical protein